MVIQPASLAEWPRKYGTGGRIEMPSVRLREWQAFFDAIDHSLVDLAVLAELALALRAFGRGEVAQAGFAA